MIGCEDESKASRDLRDGSMKGNMGAFGVLLLVELRRIRSLN